jgi:hypothetical protein
MTYKQPKIIGTDTRPEPPEEADTRLEAEEEVDTHHTDQVVEEGTDTHHAELEHEVEVERDKLHTAAAAVVGRTRDK